MKEAIRSVQVENYAGHRNRLCSRRAIEPTGFAAEMLPARDHYVLTSTVVSVERALAAQKEAPDAVCKYCAEGLFPLKKYLDGRMMHFGGLTAWYPCARPASQIEEAGK